MARARTTHADPSAPLFEDAFGSRLRLVDPAGTAVDALVVHPALAMVASFEFAVRERATRLTAFRHASYVRVRGVDRGADPGGPFRVVSDECRGIRLSELLAEAEARRTPIDVNASLCLLRQLAPALTMLHAHAREVAHGAVTPERLMVTSGARLQIAEYVFGSALEQLRYSREQYWHEMRVPTVSAAGPVHIDQRTDVLQLGLVALSLILSRPLRDEEFPSRVSDILASTWAVSARGGFEPLPAGLRAWLARALQLDPGRSFTSANDARVELDAVLGDNEYVASPGNLEAYLARYEASAPDVVVPLPAPSAGAPALTAAPPAPTPAPPAAASPPVVDLAVPDFVPTPFMPPQQYAGDEPGIGEAEVAEPGPPTWWRNWRLAGAAAAVFVVLAFGVSIGARKDGPDPPVRAESGTLEVTTNPAGVEAVVDGVPRGQTPLVLALEPGQHVVELRWRGEPRTIPVRIGPAMHVAHFVDMPQAAAPPARRSARPKTPVNATSAATNESAVASPPPPPPVPAPLDAGALPPIDR